MAKRLRFKPSRLTAILGVAVLLLGVLCLYAVLTGAMPPAPPTANERALRQVREQRGAGAELRYAEAGRGRALCGYAGVRGQSGAVAFVSRPNRILFSDDPLPVEFREMQQRFCPTFLARPSAPNNANAAPAP